MRKARAAARTVVASLLGGALLVLATAAGLAFVDDSVPLADRAVASAASARAVAKPRVIWKPVTFTDKRKRQTAAYCKRHYGKSAYRLKPRVIILHYTAGPKSATWRTTWNYFAANTPDVEYHELPGALAHFIITRDGRIFQLLGTAFRGRHCVGLNHVSIGIEFVQPAGSGGHWASQQILDRPKQVRAGLRLVRWLQDKYGITTANVWGHAMANGHPLFKDLRGWRNARCDWPAAEVKIFRKRLRALD